jgi:hypothetical protein
LFPDSSFLLGKVLPIHWQRTLISSIHRYIVTKQPDDAAHLGFVMLVLLQFPVQPILPQG